MVGSVGIALVYDGESVAGIVVGVAAIGESEAAVRVPAATERIIFAAERRIAQRSRC